ncbi:MAG: hypothetical protein COU90_03075 [Candidatus Ryanbacteria bacterium CG10_big_fil_rev_8_21_14_0_10_43_42]|uniref:DUF8128 domain-containing protein n=1 Tax=Candidatus Ryanbacteria bacterium CG10_big_fil_rev_8_21_14_0_10_43_42 TaxID=1974864 RepID=A0A2M8KWT9_9BACT|nr:MAG: hypothetical protein COU90_03075 [Candidatus Ryanbacteria bacterium CG10_big_fil_rev_8_21_14_0_10_43_42]
METQLTISLFKAAVTTWFIWLPVLSFLVLVVTWLDYKRTIFIADVEYVFLEVRVPREIRRGPKAMEQLFTSIYSILNSTVPSHIIDGLLYGEIALTMSFEIVSIGGEVHFFIKTPKKFKNILEANLFGCYADLEIAVVPDYTERMPSTYADLAENNYELWGSELVLMTDDVYPIRTYVEFESMDEYAQLDPIATLVEMLSKLQVEEELWIQFIIVPAGMEWRAKGQKVVEGLRTQSSKTTIIGGESTVSMVDRTPGQTDIIKAIERNISKPGYYTVIRYVYIAPKSIYNKDLARTGIPSAFNQYQAQTLNAFRHDFSVRTQTIWHKHPYFFPTWRLLQRRKSIYDSFIKRSFPEAPFFKQLFTGQTLSADIPIFNTEELATLYHYPTDIVLTAPSMKRVESKKVGPPAGLPIFQETGDSIQGFKNK